MLDRVIDWSWSKDGERPVIERREEHFHLNDSDRWLGDSGTNEREGVEGFERHRERFKR